MTQFHRRQPTSTQALPKQPPTAAQAGASAANQQGDPSRQRPQDSGSQGNAEEQWTRVGKRRDRPKPLTGSRPAPSGCRFRGAPPPLRHLFVYRVEKDVEDDDIVQYLKESLPETPIMGVECISHPDSKFRSFKVSCQHMVIGNLMDASVWPEGMRVRRYSTERTKIFYFILFFFHIFI